MLFLLGDGHALGKCRPTCASLGLYAGIDVRSAPVSLLAASSLHRVTDTEIVDLFWEIEVCEVRRWDVLSHQIGAP